MAVTQTASGSAAYSHQDALVTLRLQSRPTAPVQVDLELSGNPLGFLAVVGPAERTIQPADWREAASFTLRSNPTTALPAAFAATVLLDGSVELVLTSADPQYDTDTQRSIGAEATSNPLAESDGLTLVQVREVIEPGDRPIETVYVEAPQLQLAGLLEVVHGVAIEFDRNTNMGGRSVLVGLPQSLETQAAASLLTSLIRRDGFPCSGSPGVIR